MKLIEALEGLEMKEGDDFPQGDKVLRKEDHQAFLREFIFEIKGGKHKIVEVVAKEKTSLPVGLQVRLSDLRRSRRALPGPTGPGGRLRPYAAHGRPDHPLRWSDGPQQRQFRGPARRDPRRHRPQRCRQEHVLQLPHRRAAPDRGSRHLQRRGHRRPAAQPHLAEGHRALLPDHQHPSQRHHARERAHCRAVAAAQLEHAEAPPRLPGHHRQGRIRAAGRGPARARPTIWPPTSRTASSATSRSASRSPPSRSCSASTSRPPA